MVVLHGHNGVSCRPVFAKNPKPTCDHKVPIYLLTTMIDSSRLCNLSTQWTTSQAMNRVAVLGALKRFDGPTFRPVP